MASRFADGVWLVQLAPVADPAQVPSAVAAKLGIREEPGMPADDALARVLARQQVLLVMDNCEHVIAAVAELCARLLLAADDLQILATSREPLQVAGESRYRLAPLTVPDPNDLANAPNAEAVVLFTDRARSADVHFTVTADTALAVSRLVTRLDGMPLAIELAAARVETLGVTGLLDRLDDRLALLAGGNRLAPSRHRSLAAAVEWSYQLLDVTEQWVFRQLSVFPGAFTLDAAEALAGPGAGPSILHLVDCSLVVPPRSGPDGRPRYGMLETLRAYGTQLLAQAGEHDAAAVALARYALGVAHQAGAGLATNTAEEAAAARLLDAEDMTMRQVLLWAAEHDPAVALRLAVALAPWRLLRGRALGEYPVLREAADRAVPGEPAWCEAQFWLGQMAMKSVDWPTSLGHFTVVCDAIADLGPSRALALCLGGRSVTLANLGQLAEALDQARRSLVMAEELGDPDGQALGLADLAIATSYAGDPAGAVRFLRRSQQIRGVRGWIARMSDYLLTGYLVETGDLAAAKDVCVAVLARARDVGDEWNLVVLLELLADLELHAGRTDDAARHLREDLQVVLRTGDWIQMGNVLDICGRLCAATGRHADAVTLLAAMEEQLRSHHAGFPETAGWVRRHREALREAGQVLGPDAARAAEARGVAMSPATAAEYVLLLTAPAQDADPPEPGLGPLSARERELLTLVARGHTDAQIAAQLFISVRTVSSHLDRIRDKTGCRRRADLTRLALRTGLL